MGKFLCSGFSLEWNDNAWRIPCHVYETSSGGSTNFFKSPITYFVSKDDSRISRCAETQNCAVKFFVAEEQKKRSKLINSCFTKFKVKYTVNI
jgi:hypothetical protein